MVAVIVALLMIFLGFYHAWIKKIPVLAGVMMPALIMLLYAAWVMFLAKREKIRRLNAVSYVPYFRIPTNLIGIVFPIRFPCLLYIF